MAETSRIEWTDATWNVVTGCVEVSPGCDHCYARTFAERWRGVPGHHFETGFDVTLRPERLGLPMRWKRPRRVFVNSMSDLFHAAVPDEFVAEVFAVMAAAPRHTFQILTKRHARMRTLLSDPDFHSLVCAESAALAHEGVDITTNNPWEHWPLPNVWCGVSVETQHWAGIRIPALLGTPAAIRFVSAEPLLGPIDLAPWLSHGPTPCPPLDNPPGVGWVIAGGESGPGARPAHPDWLRALRDQCTTAGVPFFFKQWGEWAPLTPGIASGRETRAYPGAVLRRVGKKTAGRTLDDRTWNQYPSTSGQAA